MTQARGATADALALHLGEHGIPVERNVPAGTLTTIRVGGPFSILARPRSIEEVQVIGAARAALACDGASIPAIVVGRGSNLLVSDNGFAGVAIVLDAGFDEIECFGAAGHDDAAPGGSGVRAGGAVALPILARRAAAAGRGGLEFFVGIPGSVGGAVCMNAGGHGRQTSEVLRRAVVVDLETGTRTERAPSDLEFSYRHSAIGSEMVVVAAEFVTNPCDPVAASAEIESIVAWRRANQPGGANSGSVFTNPEGDSAGRLVEACGLKGTTVGGATVSEKHANFIQAGRGATASDVAALIAIVRARVELETGIRLVPEVRLIGFSQPYELEDES